MFYLIQVFLLVSIPIFVLTGIIVLIMVAWIEMKDYARAKLAMRRVVHAAAPGEPLRAA